MTSRLLQTLLVASFGAMAITATAQNAAPRDNPAGTNTMQTTPQSGIQAGPNSSAPANSGYGGTTGTMNSPTTGKFKALSDADIRAYKDGRTACERAAPGAAQDTCRSQFNSKWASVDPKCQKVAVGSELDQCLKGSDHAD
jgi:hypothetical protein